MTPRNSLARRLTGAAALLGSLTVAAAPEVDLVFAAPERRPYTIGDIVEVTVVATVPAAYSLDAAALPGPGALDDWLEVQTLDWSREAAATGTRYRIHVAYQIFRGVRGTEPATLPGLPIRFQGPELLEPRSPDQVLMLAPLIPPNLPDEAVVIRDAIAPLPRSLAGHRERFWLCVAGLLAAAGGRAWMRLDRGLRRLPFGRALQRLARLARAGRTAEDYRAAARTLHRALDETAGGTVFAADLDGFCRNRPAFAELREDLAGFFAASRQAFFLAPDTVPGDAAPLRGLAELCRRCAAAERRPT